MRPVPTQCEVRVPHYVAETVNMARNAGVDVPYTQGEVHIDVKVPIAYILALTPKTFFKPFVGNDDRGHTRSV